jgi:energy-coupling factor transporter ATP-binding protein EcfA2
MITATQSSCIESVIGDSENTQLSVTRNLIIEFFKALNKTGLRYCVLRNYQDMGANTSEDIDILVRPTDMLRIGRIFHAAAGENRFYVFSKKLYGRNMMLAAVAMDCDYSSATELPLVEIHLAGYVSLYLSLAQRRIKGLACRIFLDDVATGTYRFDDITIIIPDRRWEFLVLFSRLEFKPKVKYKQRCLWLLREIGTLESCETCSYELVDIINAACQGQIDGKYRLAIKHLVKAFKPALSVSVIRQACFLIVLNIKCLFKKKGLIVFLSGPDGSGKTTVWKSVTELMAKKLRCKVIDVKYLYPVNNNPPAFLTYLHGRIRKVNGSGSQAIERDRGSGFSWRFRRMSGLISIILQYPIGYIAARLRNVRGYTVIAETSYLDAFVKGHRPEFKLLQRIIVPLLPPGDMYFLLNAKPETIVRRKPELTIPEIQEYYRRMSYLTGISRVSPRLIESDRNIDASVNDVLGAILSQLDKM